METYYLPYGKASLAFQLPGEARVDTIIAKNPPGVLDPLSTVQEALLNSLEVRLDDFQGAQTAAVAVNDKTRPVPHEFLLPPLLEKLESIGITPKNIHLIIATGTHVPTPPQEYSRTLPQWIVDRYAVSSHNCDDTSILMTVGMTIRGTPVFINKQMMDADLRLAIGNIEPHHFMGFSGGGKSAAIGLAGRETITRNHSMLPHPNAVTGHYEDNPMRMDVEQIGKMMGLHFCLNAILNLEKQIVYAIAGSPEAVMRVGIPLSRQICQVSAPGKDYDLVIASAGGYPKDINFYQSQKALTHAAMVVKPGGTILLAAACPEGSGSQAYVDWMENVNSSEEAFEKFNNLGFQIGPHKAYQVARISSKAKIVLVSELPPTLVKRFLLTPQPSLVAALQDIWPRLPKSPRIAILPYAVNTVPNA